MAIALVRYNVAGGDAAEAVYSGPLGFTLRQQFGPAMAIVARGDLDLWLAGPAASAARPMPDGARPEPGGWGRIVLVVADLSLMVAALTAAGVRFRNDVVQGPGGGRSCAATPRGT